ncbi:MAG: hypothetical protein K2X27_01540 [Candidatus Obscuribacterales bacterium]|nr:hypothetical protein [Candidatus Obscuribacterales bacterium]
MKKLIPLLALLMVTASTDAAFAGSKNCSKKKCEKGSSDECCKDKDKADAKDSKAESKDSVKEEKPADSK